MVLLFFNKINKVFCPNQVSNFTIRLSFAHAKSTGIPEQTILFILKNRF